MTKQPKTFFSLEGYGADQGVDTFLTGAGYSEAMSMDNADIIVFNGGTDVATELYGERSTMAYVPEFASVRDKYEKGVFDKYKGQKFFLGICRGAQFLNVMNGGSLWQDVNHHGHPHPMFDLLTSRTIRVTSTHHQMMIPNMNDGELIAVASESTKKMRWGELKNINPMKEPDLDVEVMWYPKNRSLCIQGHPEYVPGSEFADWSLGLVSKFYKEEVFVDA